MSKRAPGSEETMRDRARIAARLARFLETNLAELAKDDAFRVQLEATIGVIVDAFGLAPLDGKLDGILTATETELTDRLRHADLTPFIMPTPEQAAILLRGLPFTIEELSTAGLSAAEAWVPYGDGLSSVEVAGGLHAAGAIQGAIAASWSR